MEILSKIEARARGFTRFFTGVPCRHGHTAQRMISDGYCCECNRLANKVARHTPQRRERDRLKRRVANLTPEQLERRRAKDRANYIRDKDKLKVQWNRWAANNRGHINAAVKRYKVAKLNAQPAWADEMAMKAIYDEAARLSAETGIPRHVDHIVPLQSPIVCGLHCEANLQVLTETENCTKNNLHWPDMP